MSDELGLGNFFEFCNNDAGFNTFLKGFNDYVEGDIKIEDLFSVDFLFEGKLDNCVVTNTYLTNQFLYQLLKLYSIATVNSTKVVCKHFGSISDICSGISMKSFIGNKLRRKKLVFKLSVQMICAVINFICSRYTLDWSGMDSGQVFSVSNTNAIRNLLNRMYKNLRKIFEDKHISFQDKQSFGVQNFEMTPIYEFFTTAVVKKASTALDDTNDVTVIAGGSGSNSDKHCISRTNRRACADKNLNPNFKIGSKRKASALSGSKSNNNHSNTKSLPRNKCKIAIWATAYKRKLTTIQNLKAKLREHESKVKKAYSSYMEKALAAAKKESDEIIQNLQSRVVEYEAKLIHRDEIHKQLNESYQRLKNDYECEVENHFNDVENILSKSCEQSFSSFTDNCPYLSKFYIILKR